MSRRLDVGVIREACEELHPSLTLWVRHLWDHEVPPLYYSDIAGLAMLRAEIDLQRRTRVSDLRSAEYGDVRRASILVLRVLVPELLEVAEFWPPGEPEPEYAWAIADRAIRSWDEEILSLVEAKSRGHSWSAVSREAVLARLYAETNRESFASDAELLRLGAIGLRLRGGPSHSADDSTPSAVAAELKLQWFLGNESRIFAVGSDGLVKIDVRGLRDQGRPTRRLRKTQLIEDPEGGTGAILASGATNDARAAVDAVQATDDARKVREVIAARLAELPPRSSAWHCVSNACALLTGELSVAALAREIGAGSRAMQKAWKAESRILRDRFRAALGA